MVEPRQDLAAIYRAGIRAVNAHKAVMTGLSFKNGRLSFTPLGKPSQCLDPDRFEHIRVVGAGKASASMAAALEDILGSRITGGAVCVKYGHGENLQRISVTEAGHPVPDENGVAGARAILDLVSRATQKDLVIALISGGGSALIPLPPDAVTLEEKQAVTRLLLDCGADIRETNSIRKHLSRIKGGQLARAAYPARVVCLVISDVVGDPLDAIASGPFVGDPTTFSQAWDILEKYDLLRRVPPAAVRHLAAGKDGGIPETPAPSHPIFDRVDHVIAASNTMALEAARITAESLGYNTLILSSAIEGDTAEAAAFHAAIAQEVKASGNPVPAPACILSGGETTVRVKGNGKGGRNMEFALRAAPLISGREGILVAGIGTDGSDGPTDAAGALADHTTLARAGALGLDTRAYMDNNDAYPYFNRLGDLIITGPTRTNVMDLRVMLII